ncbi:hypothetical protein FA10DRAFT_266212 [Acaromyces ingoldii]|uniref:HTH APSES-type domain-containing protein n=1 Tax=Acaromyces ingoldii TaxID=215250 RepID=A0A316YTJ7_9BASI|nr:hypothetical protein FA10DRAFT_266212 [Acaromyces ingoldii]PWN92452.1 hypothetical protein FA10DRAFT_266212 [Acaromyces ingoldii]
MAGSRRSTPRRARSSSVASNVSTASAKQENTTPRKKAASKREASASARATPTPKDKDAGAADVETTPSAASKKENGLRAAQAKALAARPPLPERRNPVLPDADVPVKVQVIRRDGQNIIIGRVKLPTVNGTDHSFLLKRFDTNALAASSMYRLAFPYADGEAERGEMEYLEKRYDAEMANGGLEPARRRPRGRPSKKAAQEHDEAAMAERKLPPGSTGVRLQGTWIPSADALEVAKEYGLTRYAQPLIEAKAEYSDDNGGPVLTPSKNDKVSTPSRSTKRQRRIDEQEVGLDGESPSVTRTRTTRTTQPDGSERIEIEQTETSIESSKGLTEAQIQAELQASKALAQGLRQSADSSSTTRGTKRRAANQAPSANIDVLADDDEDTNNAVVRSIRSGARAARRRPVATATGALGAAGAVGVGALAWISGGNLDMAVSLVQQGLQNAGSWFSF